MKKAEKDLREIVSDGIMLGSRVSKVEAAVIDDYNKLVIAARKFLENLDKSRKKIIKKI